MTRAKKAAPAGDQAAKAASTSVKSDNPGSLKENAPANSEELSQNQERSQGAKMTPEFSLTKSKKGLIHVWVKLPRSVPSSCLNMDATETHFHLDTKKWGSNYEIDIPYPPNTTVILKEGEEAEAEFQGGMLKVRIKTTESEGIFENRKSSGKRALSNSDGGGILKKQRTQESKNKKQDTAQETKKESAKKESANKELGEKPKASKSQKAKAVTEAGQNQSEKSSCLKLIDDISNAEETKIQSKLNKEKERDEALAKIEEVRKKRKEDKLSRKQDLLSKLKAKKGEAATAAAVEAAAAAGAESEEEPAAAATKGAGASGKTPKEKKQRKRVSWGADEHRSFE